MKNTFVIITLIALLGGLNGQSQKMFNKKSILEASFNFNPISRPSITSTPLFEAGIGGRVVPVVNLHLEYKVGLLKKIAIGLLYDYNSTDFRTGNDYDYWQSIPDLDRIEMYTLNSNSITTNYGVSINLYTNDFIAPIGNSFSIFYKRNLSKIKKVKLKYRVRESNSFTYYGEEEGTMVFTGHTIGLGVNRMFFLSDKAPVYLKYGASIGIMFGGELEFNKESFDIFNDNSPFHNYKKFLVINEILNLEIGLGINF